MPCVTCSGDSSPQVAHRPAASAVASISRRSMPSRRSRKVRGLRPTGDCDEQTWLAICRGRMALGDRALELEAPQVRGDDVVTLQQGLNHLGFDCGRPDGILGPATVRRRRLPAQQWDQGRRSVRSHHDQHARTVAASERQRPRCRDDPRTRGVPVTSTFESARIVIGQFGGLSAITRGLARSLRNDGATVMSTDEYEASAHAAAANRFGATVYVGFEPRTEPGTTIAYFAVPHFESFGGRALATSLAIALDGVVSSDPTIVGMRLPVLRETRMPAVVVTSVRSAPSSTPPKRSARPWRSRSGPGCTAWRMARPVRSRGQPPSATSSHRRPEGLSTDSYTPCAFV